MLKVKYYKNVHVPDEFGKMNLKFDLQQLKQYYRKRAISPEAIKKMKQTQIISKINNLFKPNSKFNSSF